MPTKTTICALYKFVRLDDAAELREPLLEKMLELKVRGTLLLATEGINGTIAGSAAAIEKLLGWLEKDERFFPLDRKYSHSDEMPFLRSKVRLKKEIVTLGVENIDPTTDAGQYVDPHDWNKLIAEPDVILVDTRNDYEVQLGSFRGAIDPQTKTFREFPDFVEKNLSADKKSKVAMYCTGGIRCEKSTALLKKMGFEQVYHLRGGILKYLEEIPETDSSWQGECFVFDERVSVDHRLEPGEHILCHGCRQALNATDMKSPDYVEGVSCPYCIDSLSETRKQALAERQRQIEIARQRGENHLGTEARELTELRRAKKGKK